MKVRIGAGGANLKTISALHVRTVAGVGGLKTIPNAHVRTAAGAGGLKSFWAPGGGTAGTLRITPAFYSSSSLSSNSNASDFTANTSGGPMPTTYTWSITGVSNGTATILSGQGTPTVRVKLTSIGSASATCNISCTVRFDDGSNATDTALKQHRYTGP